MEVTADNWKNKRGTSDRSCKCGTWKQHWLKFSGDFWPIKCSISNCNNIATLGAHIINSQVRGEYIIPACSTCNQLSDEFNIKDDITLIPANKSVTCENY